MGIMSNHENGFRSRAERQREDALEQRYRRIGIPAVAAAKTVERQYGQSRQVPQQQMGSIADPDRSQEI
ncbi:MAG: hypothetical protein BroJett030_30990 [Alphaproteobacteria bacterium]|nr:MAG: hypothetical protein BroJett030_30990 [Alphaproteobacteria bacterium]